MGTARQNRKRRARQAKRKEHLAQWDYMKLKKWKPGEFAIWIPHYSPDEYLVEILQMLTNGGSYQIYKARILNGGEEITVGGEALFHVAPNFGRERKPRPVRRCFYLVKLGEQARA